MIHIYQHAVGPLFCVLPIIAPSVNAQGALITLTGEVQVGQSLVLTSLITQEQQSCKVVYLGDACDGKTSVGVEFNRPAPRFWHIEFPPERAAQLYERERRVPHNGRSPLGSYVRRWPAWARAGLAPLLSCAQPGATARGNRPHYRTSQGSLRWRPCCRLRRWWHCETSWP